MAKNIKGRKFVATAASAALVASAIVPVASAATEFSDASSISSWAKKAVDHLVSEGVLEGDANGKFNPSKELTRGEAATVLAKALGLTIDTTKKTTLTDAVNHWSSSAIAALQASNPEIIKGYEDGTFKPDGKITRQEFAKMIVTAFDLKLVEGADVNFTDNKGWGAEFITILASNGIAAGTSTTTFGPEQNVTREAAATFAFRTLVEEERIGLEAGATAIESVTAITNTKVAVVLKAAVKSVKAADFTVEGLTVSSATLSKDGKTVTLETSAQTAGKLYTVTANKTSGSWVALVADTVKPVVAKVVSVTNTLVEVEFELEDATEESILNAANYTFDNGLTASAVAYKPNSKNVVYVTTSSQTAGTVYNLTVANVQDASGNKVDSTKKFAFAGKSKDTTAPTLVSAVSKKGNKVTVTFNDASQLDAASISNAANYTIAGLTVNAAEVTSNPLTGGTITVELSTSTQTAGTVYKVVAKNIKDVVGNTPSSDLEAQFAGTTLDTTPPSVTSAVSTTNTKVKVTFNDDLDSETALNAANYTIEGLTVTGAAFDKLANGKDDKDVVILTTSAQTAGTVYKVKVANVKDEAGNAITSSQTTEALFAGKSADTVKPTIVLTTGLAGNKVTIKFSEAVTEASVKTLTNYVIDGLGYATSASYDKASNTVTLTTATQEAGKVYKVTVNGIVDEAGNEIAKDTKVEFAGVGNAAAAPALESVVALNKTQVQVKFNKDVTGVAAGDFTLTGTSAPIISGVTKVDNKTYILTLASDLGLNVYKLEVTGTITDLGGTNLPLGSTEAAKNSKTFAGVDYAAPGPVVQAVTQVSPTLIQLTFDQEITAGSLFVSGTTDISVTYDGTERSVTALSVNGKKATLTVAAIPADKVVKVTIKDLSVIKDVTNSVNVKPTNTTTNVAETTFGSVAFATTAVKLSSVVSIDEQTLELQLNQGVQITDATVTDLVTAFNNTGVLPTGVTVTDVEQTDTNKLRVYFKTATATTLAEGTLYDIDLSAVATSGELLSVLGNSWSTNAAELKGKFGYNKTENPAPYLIAATPIGESTIQVTFSEAVKNFDATNDFVLKVDGGATITTVGAPVAVGTDGKTYIITLSSGVFTLGTTYSLTIKDDGSTVVQDINGVDIVKVVNGSTPITVKFGGTVEGL